MTRAYKTEEWVKKAKLRWEGIHEYDYSKVEYIRGDKRVLIGCPYCDDFIPMIPFEHVRKRKGNTGCPRCGEKRFKKKQQKFTTEHVIEQFIAIHGDMYDYSEVDYKGDDQPVKIICRKHGPWYPTPSDHKQGKGCQSCYRESQILDLNNFAIGYIKVIRQATPQEIKDKNLYGDQAYWWVKCACGSQPFITPRNRFTRKDRDLYNMSCKVCADRRRSIRMSERKYQEIKDNQYGFLSILRDWGTDLHGNRYLMCKCRCGKRSITRMYHLIDGLSVSCGCNNGSDNYFKFSSDDYYASLDCHFYVADMDEDLLKPGITSSLKKRRNDLTTELDYLFNPPKLNRAEVWAIEQIILYETRDAEPNPIPKKFEGMDGQYEMRLKKFYPISFYKNRYYELLEEMQSKGWQELYLENYGESNSGNA